MILGNTEGVRKGVLEELETIHGMTVNSAEVVSPSIIEMINRISLELNREISVGINRRGNIISVAIGDATTVDLPIIDVKEKKLSAVRIIHTHPSGNSKLSAVDISALIKMKLDCIVAIGVNEEPEKITANIGFCDVKDNILIADEIHDLTLEGLLKVEFRKRVTEISTMIQSMEIFEDTKERAVLVGIDNEESLVELEELAKACNVDVQQKILQKRTKPDTAFYVGSGKVKEIGLIAQIKHANVIIFDDELSGSQVRNLEANLGIKVIDRTTLILDIFAKRATSKEGKIQVELAMLKYRLPRLGGLGTVLSRTGAGIGTRGPGEKKLEIDRRHIRNRVFELNKSLEKARTTRELQRKQRHRNNINKVSLVGYTNAGKSTLRNKLVDVLDTASQTTKEKVFEANMLFATLETTARAFKLPDGRDVIISDTVGFISKLPHDLVEAFKSTLEEVIEADVLLHVVDASSDTAKEQIEVVEHVLEEIGAGDKESILVLNKMDQANEEALEELKKLEEKVICISAKEGINLDELVNEISNVLPGKLHEGEFLIPYSDQSVVAYIHNNANVLEEEYREEGTYLKAQVDDIIYNKYSQYIIKE